MDKTDTKMLLTIAADIAHEEITQGFFLNPDNRVSDHYLTKCDCDYIEEELGRDASREEIQEIGREVRRILTEIEVAPPR